MFSNLRFTYRTLIKSPGFALTAIAALALGVGANTAIFSLVNQLLLNPPGISNPDRIVSVGAKYDKLNLKSIPLSAPDFSDVRDNTQIFANAAMMNGLTSTTKLRPHHADDAIRLLIQLEEDLPNANLVDQFEDRRPEVSRDAPVSLRSRQPLLQADMAETSRA